MAIPLSDAPAHPRRFYKQAAATPERGVTLDARALRTPAKQVFVAPTQALADAVAAEWAGQGEFIIPSSMPLTQFAFAAIDRGPQERDALAAYVAKFGETDLLCHRADAPAALVERQDATWTPLLHWAEAELGVRLPVVEGVVAARIEPAHLDRLKAHAGALDDFRLTALSQAAGLAGSALIAFALLRGRLDAEAAFAAAALDDLWSLERWGEDAEARARLERMRDEFAALARFFASLS